MRGVDLLAQVYSYVLSRELGPSFYPAVARVSSAGGVRVLWVSQSSSATLDLADPSEQD